MALVPSHKKCETCTCRRNRRRLWRTIRYIPRRDIRSDAELKVFFQKHIVTSDQAVNSTIGTFKALCSLADFKRKKAANTSSVGTLPDAANQRQSVVVASAAQTAPAPASPQAYPTVHTDIQIHIHPDADADQIREIFKNMAIYLYDRDVN